LERATFDYFAGALEALFDSNEIYIKKANIFWLILSGFGVAFIFKDSLFPSVTAVQPHWVQICALLTTIGLIGTFFFALYQTAKTLTLHDLSKSPDLKIVFDKIGQEAISDADTLFRAIFSYHAGAWEENVKAIRAKAKHLHWAQRAIIALFIECFFLILLLNAPAIAGILCPKPKTEASYIMPAQSRNSPANTQGSQPSQPSNPPQPASSSPVHGPPPPVDVRGGNAYIPMSETIQDSNAKGM